MLSKSIVIGEDLEARTQKDFHGMRLGCNISNWFYERILRTFDALRDVEYRLKWREARKHWKPQTNLLVRFNTIS